MCLQNWDYSTPARHREKRLVATVPNKDFADATAAARRLAASQRHAAEVVRDIAQDELLDKEQFKADYMRNLREQILKGLSFVHDYKQINAQIIQNINVVIESRYSGADFDEKLDHAAPAERAIYEAAKFLEEKLNVAKFLLKPEWLEEAGECVRFRVHGLVLKYQRIYKSFFSEKGIRVLVTGSSHAEVVANPQAVGVIPHTLIDNALKYAPRRSKVEVHISDVENGVLLEVTSLGPLIEPSERKKIFQPFFRGKAAVEIAEEGAGYGLYVSQLVARSHLGTAILVEQDAQSDSAFPTYFETTFSVVFPLKAKVC